LAHSLFALTAPGRPFALRCTTQVSVRAVSAVEGGAPSYFAVGPPRADGPGLLYTAGGSASRGP
jgi:hypothetical protein